MLVCRTSGSSVIHTFTSRIGTSGSGAHQPSQPISPESATALFSLPQMVATTTPAMSNLQMLIAEMTSAAGGSGVLSDVPASSLTGNANNMNRVPVPPTASEALQDVPAKPFLDYLSSIDEIWREYRYGDPQSARPSIIELDSKYGDKWRKKVLVWWGGRITCDSTSCLYHHRTNHAPHTNRSMSQT